MLMVRCAWSAPRRPQSFASSFSSSSPPRAPSWLLRPPRPAPSLWEVYLWAAALASCGGSGVRASM
eukprot:806952-Pyramimonas_sp.AAC.1